MAQYRRWSQKLKERHGRQSLEAAEAGALVRGEWSCRFLVKRVGAVAGQRELLGKTGQLVGKKGNHAQVDFGADLGGIHTVLQKYLEPVDADDDSEKNASQSALAHPPSA